MHRIAIKAKHVQHLEQCMSFRKYCENPTCYQYQDLMYDKGPLQEGKESRSNLISYNGATGWPYGKKEQEKVE